MVALLWAVSGVSHAQSFGVSIPPTDLPDQALGLEHYITTEDGPGSGGTAMGDINGDGFDDMLFLSNDLSQQLGPPAVRTVGVLDGRTGVFLDPPHIHPDPTLNLAVDWGRSICVIGDLDGDGSDEYAVGAPGLNSVYVYWGNPSITPFQVSPSPTGFTDNLLCIIEQLPAPSQGAGSNPHFGHSLAGAGDLNMDAVPDLWIGDNTVQTSGGNAHVRIGAVYLISGNELVQAWKKAVTANDPALRLIDSSANMGKITMEREPSGVQYLGEHLAGGMDATGDGYPDLLVTARHVDFVLNGGPWHSGVLLFSGRRFYRPIHTYTVPAIHAQGPSADETFGHSISFTGDIEGAGTASNGLETGMNDVLIGDPGQHSVGDPGFAFVYSSASADLLEVLEGTSNNGTGSSMGQRVGSAGDVDGDGLGDYFVTEPRHREPGDGNPGAGTGRGQAIIVKGGSGIGLPPNQAFRFDEQLGASVTALHGIGMATSGDPLVYIPGVGFTTSGFMCYSSVSTVSNHPASLTSTEYH